jgi:hypothetical protein
MDKEMLVYSNNEIIHRSEKWKNDNIYITVFIKPK